MKTEREIRRRLTKLEKQLSEQLGEILASAKGFGGPESVFFDACLVQRHTLRFVLGLRHKPFHPVIDAERFR